jgi:hypothetical protein
VGIFNPKGRSRRYTALDRDDKLSANQKTIDAKAGENNLPIEPP